MTTNPDPMAARFAAETATHVMTVLHDDDLYRHLRFKSPDSSFYWFDLITWPGNLAIRGDVDSLMFNRDRDMFQFFRRQQINPGYWAEKTPDHGKSLKEYSEDTLESRLDELITDYEEQYVDLRAEYETAQAAYDALPRTTRWTHRPPVEPMSPTAIRELITECSDDGELSHEDGARTLLQELEARGVASDTWEWNLAEWRWSYLWCCHAIVWGIAQYDASKQAEATEHDGHDVDALRQWDAIYALHTESVAGVCPTCYRLGDASDTDDGLVAWPCPTLRAMGVEDAAPMRQRVHNGHGTDELTSRPVETLALPGVSR